MTEPTLILMMGLPRSGKTTAARTIAENEHAPIVCPDAIRLALHGQRFAGLAEPFVWAIAKVMVRALFKAGHSKVILDSTATTRARRDEWKSKDWRREVAFVRTSCETCLSRAHAEGDKDIVPIIDRMALQMEHVAPDEELPEFRGLMP